MTEAKPRKRRSPREARRLILDAARDELLGGRGELEMTEVARRAGVSEGLAYYHFGNKAGLLNAVVKDFYERLDEAVLAIPYEGASWRERERARTYEFIRLMYEDPVAPLVVDVLRADPGFAAEERERRRRLNLLGARNIAEAQRAGEIDEALDPALLVSMILGGVTTGVSHALSARPPLPLADAQRQIWAFVERAAGLPPG
ncbi:TetR/AcrR family transcriptional regulator [Parvibaculum sp.]|uniref:TetR/AcrR family transcriptional regulator n=1 Tax=Parvibaculum sp. TaxID=2024848 RepID=UPI001B1A0316|nr:TetR/AcrR family transcriptional regulator [Parvibaculum sp.]MBO6636302.1 TetR/AcrR family transcriptional regulator [Parvibaculum sp.]MBO6677326.1 TetR/AcrR family transcriptional regulator [Parvibaculum sp.]MBO6686020.1 TetR/AcrR family transcriptional regulator [Parvibaculum sp.]MBO6906557.1 TetR/AcrR family transcriptional regulator [Parvibaculum sp.]